MSPSPLPVGNVLGDKFEICGILGEGASGIVYDARPLRGAPERVALKVVHPHLLGDSQIRGRFVREAAILRRLTGEHLCPILEFGELTDPRSHTGILYMAIPKIDGPSLERLLAANGPLEIKQVVDIAFQICSALTEAHAQGVIHRDLKPANVLLRESGHVYVVDFGMAKIVTGGGTGTTSLTTHNMVFGTPEYMAPEQARGEELDARCDVYAVGVILYELLTGEVPFHGHTPLVTLTAHMTFDVPRITRADVGPALAAVVYHALSKSPEDRYGSASDLAHALEHARLFPQDIDAVSPRLPESTTVRLPSSAALEAADATTGRTTRVRMPPPRWGGVRWLLIWAFAIVAGIAIGVYLSLYTSF